MMAPPKTLEDEFAAYCAACFGVASPHELPDKQRLQNEDAFMAGALAAFTRVMGGDWETTERTLAEIKDFQARVVERYEAAGLPLGARPS